MKCFTVGKNLKQHMGEAGQPRCPAWTVVRGTICRTRLVLHHLSSTYDDYWYWRELRNLFEWITVGSSSLKITFSPLNIPSSSSSSFNFFFSSSATPSTPLPGGSGGPLRNLRRLVLHLRDQTDADPITSLLGRELESSKLFPEFMPFVLISTLTLCPWKCVRRISQMKSHCTRQVTDTSHL